MVCSPSLAYFSSSASRQIFCSGMASATGGNGSFMLLTIYGLKVRGRKLRPGRMKRGVYCDYIQYMPGMALRQDRHVAGGVTRRACLRILRPHILGYRSAEP